MLMGSKHHIFPFAFNSHLRIIQSYVRSIKTIFGSRFPIEVIVLGTKDGLSLIFLININAFLFEN